MFARLAILAILGALFGSTPRPQHQLPVCPPSCNEVIADCAKPLTGCICSVQSAVICQSKSNCKGCRVIYAYSWSCTNPFDEGSADGTVNMECGTMPPSLQFGTCVCDGSPLISLSFSCGNCPGG